MSLYHEATSVLKSSSEDGGSIKSIVFTRKDWKSNPKALFALATETAKWSGVLSEVIEKASLLESEKDVSPTLALLLTHDLLLAKKGLALPTKHGLRVAIERHKARLGAEFTKARLRRGCATIEALKVVVDRQADEGVAKNGDDEQRFVHPRWIRINTLRSGLDEQLESTFRDYKWTKTLSDITNPPAGSDDKLLHIDKNVPNLIAISPNTDITHTPAYKSGALILQDKASCFPAYLLEPQSSKGDIIDACAAPGNKTTHIAALIAHSNGLIAGQGERKRSIIACERDVERSKTLEKMVKRAGAGNVVRVKGGQDFLRLDPMVREFENVTALLLDPSCSGSGIVGRDEGTIKIHLPKIKDATTTNSKKRKRKGIAEVESTSTPMAINSAVPSDADAEEIIDAQPNDRAQLKARLESLSSLQLRLLEHAMSFPAACRITYSTCSLHAEENEHVVVRALSSDIARKRGWRVLLREKQVPGLRKWRRRGDVGAIREAMDEDLDESMIEEVAEACLRCEKSGEEGTMGFFVCAFVRVGDEQVDEELEVHTNGHKSDDEDEWNGFGD